MKIERFRATDVTRRVAVSQVWLSGVANTYSDILNTDFSLGIQKHNATVVKKARQGSWTTDLPPEVALRISVKEIDPVGSLPTTTFFGQWCFKEIQC